MKYKLLKEYIESKPFGVNTEISILGDGTVQIFDYGHLFPSMNSAKYVKLVNLAPDGTELGMVGYPNVADVPVLDTLAENQNWAEIKKYLQMEMIRKLRYSI